jgi:hypothetical protein
MRLVKRHPDTLGSWRHQSKSAASASTVCVHRDKIFCYRQSLVYDTNLALIADLSDYFPVRHAVAPMCDDADGRYWQAGARLCVRANL